VPEFALQLFQGGSDSLGPDTCLTEPFQDPCLGEGDERDAGLPDALRFRDVEEWSAPRIAARPAVEGLLGDSQVSSGVGHAHQRPGKPHVIVHASSSRIRPHCSIAQCDRLTRAATAVTW
jgi:hypothetical protein